MSKVADYVKRQPVVAGPDATVEDAARLMVQHGVGAVVIVDVSKRPIGIITERDLVRVVAERKYGARALDVGTRGDLLTASPEDDVYQALKNMREKKVRHLIVVDKEGRVAGVVSIRDLLEDKALKALGERAWWPPPED
ncbi:MAG: CBS domain-containing protein [Pyrobaculum sp.]